MWRCWNGPRPIHVRLYQQILNREGKLLTLTMVVMTQRCKSWPWHGDKNAFAVTSAVCNIECKIPCVVYIEVSRYHLDHLETQSGNSLVAWCLMKIKLWGFAVNCLVQYSTKLTYRCHLEQLQIVEPCFRLCKLQEAVWASVWLGFHFCIICSYWTIVYVLATSDHRYIFGLLSIISSMMLYSDLGMKDLFSPSSCRTTHGVPIWAVKCEHAGWKNCS